MNHQETNRLKQAIQQHQINIGECRHIFINVNYAFRLQKEMECTEEDLARNVGTMHLAIVDGLSRDFVIVS